MVVAGGVTRLTDCPAATGAGDRRKRRFAWRSVQPMIERRTANAGGCHRGWQASRRLAYRAIAIVLLVSSLAAMIASSPADAGHQRVPRNCPAVPFDPAAFTDPTRIDNPFLPMVPGTQLILKGHAEGERHRVVFTVTSLTKTIDGIQSKVIWEQDFRGRLLEESELAFFAQDKTGNVWGLGEYPEEYERGKFRGAPETWVTGHDGAEAGFDMMAAPRVGTKAYRQGDAPDIELLDCGQVIETRLDLCVPAGCYNNAVLIKEWSPLESAREYQLKYHAPGVGVVKVAGHPKKGAERLRLAKERRLSQRDLRDADNVARAMDARACREHAWYCALPPVH